LLPVTFSIQVTSMLFSDLNEWQATTALTVGWRRRELR